MFTKRKNLVDVDVAVVDVVVVVVCSGGLLGMRQALSCGLVHIWSGPGSCGLRPSRPVRG